MARKKETQNQSASGGKQLDLIDVAPENAKKIIGVVRRYRAAQAQRLEALAKEVDEKQKLLALVKDANLQRLENGIIRFHIDDMLITITPRDELIKIKDETEDETETD